MDGGRLLVLLQSCVENVEETAVEQQQHVVYPTV